MLGAARRFDCRPRSRRRRRRRRCPPTYFPHPLSLDSYQRLWSYQAGLPTYLFNSGGAALLTIAFCLALAVPAGYALARFPLPGKEFMFIVLLLALIVPYQALLTPLFFIFAQFTCKTRWSGWRSFTRRFNSRSALHHPQHRRSGAARTRRGGGDGRLLELADARSTSSCRRSAGDHHRFAVRLHHFMERVSRLAGDHEPDTTFTLPLILPARASRPASEGRIGECLQAGITISIIPCVLFYVLLQKYYVAGFLNGAIK